MCMSYSNTSHRWHHSQAVGDARQVSFLTGESSGDFSGDYSGDWYQHSGLGFLYTDSSLAVIQMSCQTWLLEISRLLAVDDATSISCCVTPIPVQRSSCILLQVSNDDALSLSFDAYSPLFLGWLFLDILIRPCKLLSPYRYQLTSSVSSVCVRLGDEHQKCQLLSVCFRELGGFITCNLFFYMYFFLLEGSGRGLLLAQMVPVWGVQTRMSGIHLPSVITCPCARAWVRLRHDAVDCHIAFVRRDGEFLEAGIQQLADVWSWYRTSVRKFIGSLCELGAASIEAMNNRTCIRLTDIEGSDPLGHLTCLCLSPSDFLSKRFNLSRWPTATPRLCRGYRGRFTAHYGSVP